MKQCWSILCLSAVLFWCCSTPEPQTQPPAETGCAVDSLIQQIQQFQTQSQKKSSTANLEKSIQSVLHGLEKTADPEATCNYLNTDIQPDHVRFEFVDDLTNWTVRDTFTPGLNYLLELRGLFADDSAIYEFFSEAIARVALQNPSCYDRYLRVHPGQITMLLNTTQWNFQDVAQCRTNFESIDALPEITNFLKDLLPRTP